MKKLGITITYGLEFRNFMLYIFMQDVLPQFDSVIIYKGLDKSTYKYWMPSYLAIKIL